jgi:cytochrome oxidase complex assembly protein 1
MSTQPNQMSNSVVASLNATPTVARKGWFSRNWKWLVPALLIVFIVLPLAFLGSIFAAMKNSDVVKESLLRARSNPLVVQKLGTPIEEGWLVSGSINVSTTSGDADLSVPISGPKGKGNIYVTAHKSAGVWDYQVMEAAIEGSNQRVNLLSGLEVTPGAEFPPTPPIPTPQGTPPGEAQPAPPTSHLADPPAPSPTAGATSASEQAGVIQTQETTSQGIVAEITECRRQEGVLTIKVRFRNSSNRPSNLTLTHYMKDENESFYVTAGKKKYFILRDSEGAVLSSNSVNESGKIELKLEPGQTFLWWAKYPAPSADVKKINFMMPVTPPFEDVPITDK